jgi:NTP pyrophosphatase (non-canonical NTP hydrolase)
VLAISSEIVLQTASLCWNNFKERFTPARRRAGATRILANSDNARARVGAGAYDRAVEFGEYQTLSRRTAEYPRDAWLSYPALGLSGEAGEVAEHAKKAIRDERGRVSEERRAAIAAELGDVLWYVAQLASELELELEQIAQANLTKLISRQRRGVLSGSGDNR